MELSRNLPWLLIVLPIVLVIFIIFETRGVLYPETQNTLSQMIYNIVHRWPLTLYFAGMLTGILIVHLFQRLCPICPGG